MTTASKFTKELIKIATIAEEISGIAPQAWVLVGNGFSKEEVKEVFLAQGAVLSKNAVLSLRDLPLLLIDQESILTPYQARLVIEGLFQEESIQKSCPSLFEMSRREALLDPFARQFLQTRKLFATNQELEVMLQTLREKKRELRPELFEFYKLSVAFDAVCLKCEYLDAHLAYRAGVDSLAESANRLPEKIYFLQEESSFGGERLFLEHLCRLTSVEELQFEHGVNEVLATARNGHLAQDATLSLVEKLQEKKNVGDQVVLIPDDPWCRRVLMHTLEGYQVPLEDERDPTLMRYNEGFKIILLGLDLIRNDYPLKGVVEWIGNSFEEETEEWIDALVRGGFTRGFDLLKRMLPQQALRQLPQPIEGDLSLDEFFDRLNEIQALSPSEVELDAFLSAWKEEEEGVHAFQRSRSIRTWAEILAKRVETSPPPILQERKEGGMRLYRIGQGLPLDLRVKSFDLHVLGFNPSTLFLEDLSTESIFLRAEMDALGGDFDLPTAGFRQETVLGHLRRYFHSAREMTFHQYGVQANGSLLEGHDLLELFLNGLSIRLEHEAIGSYHPSFFNSFERKEVVLDAPTRMSASTLDRYSKCKFLGILSLWKVEDLRWPSFEGYPESFGIMLHEALEELMKRRELGESTLALKSQTKELLTTAFQHRLYAGLNRSPLAKSTLLKKAVAIVHAFLDAEEKYQKRSQTKVFSVEEEVDLTCDGIQIYGRADRVDEHQEGLFVIDYKQSSDVPSGKEMIEKGYRLQLPFYALAMSEKTKKKVVGAQFITLNLQASRSKGIFSSLLNGKEDLNLTHTRSKLNLFEREPEELFLEAEKRIQETVFEWKKGDFTPAPKREQDCDRCRAQVACGKKRWGVRLSEEVRSG